LRYEKEPDFQDFKDRLEIYPLDLRNFQAVSEFCDFLNRRLPHLDILIHNAAQTLRRETTYYQHLLPTESTPVEALSLDASKCLPNDFSYERTAIKDDQKDAKSLQDIIPRSDLQRIQLHEISTASLESQKMLIHENPLERAFKFPSNALDINKQQIDLSKTNSWSIKADQVPFIEFVEAQVINSWAPYWLTVGLKPLLKKSPSTSRYVVNVSSMEGKFHYEHPSIKKSYHPHTNMAKAALNMFTRTSGRDFAEDNIFMTSVDTGWVSMMLPCDLGNEKYDKKYLEVPLDEIDGAMRVLDPIFLGFDQQIYLHSVFLKDYNVVSW
jgi:NAD(P)-dependent dehydrogenase (short-subunit alcohol dehydrogenase family)